MRTVISVSDLKVSGNLSETLVTYALGSCLGVVAYDRVSRVGGLMHVMLPLSRTNPEKARLNPARYVDTGFDLLMRRMYLTGAQKKDLVISVAGGARMEQAGRDDYFKIGKRNVTILRKLLWKNDFIITRLDVGGGISRTMSVRISDGLVMINKKPM